MNNYVPGLKKFFKFGIVGLVNTILSYTIYYICLRLHFHYMLSNFIAFIITVFLSFLLNGRFVFSHATVTVKLFLKALSKVYLSYLFNSLFLSSVLLAIKKAYFSNS